MSNIKRVTLSIVVVLFLALSGNSQTPAPCQPGTLANVLGTSCSVGPMIFNFGNAFSAGFFVTGAGSGVISPQEIGFFPVQEDNRSGFKLVVNFTDGLESTGSFHFADYSYTPQAAPGFEIRKQALSLDGSVQGASSGFAASLIADLQDYPNSGFVTTSTSISNANNTTFSKPFEELFLEVPGFFSNGLPGGQFNVFVENFTSGSAVTTITSLTHSYVFGPVVPAPRLASLTYANIDLPGVATTFVSNITNSGRMVGTYLDTFGGFHGYIAEPDGSFTTVDVPGALATFAAGLNERGDIVGSYTDFGGQNHGFVRQDGAVTNIDVPQAMFTSPITINDTGQIVGEYRAADFSFHGFLLDNGVFTTIDQGPGTGGLADSAAFAINNAGVIGGTFFDPRTFRAYLLEGDKSESIDVPGQGDTTIEGINNPGDTVGIFNDINLMQHGFVRSAGVFQTVDFPGGNNSAALAINAPGKIVGQYLDTSGASHSFIAVPAVDDGLDHRPSSSAAPQPQPRPDCSDTAWRLRRDQLRNAGSCQPKP